MESPKEQQKRVLIAEDDTVDMELMTRAFSHPPGWEVRLAHDGEEALDLLTRSPDSWRPNLIILNLRMPKLSGHEVLEAIKQLPNIAPIPVVVWSVSCAHSDIDRAYELGAAAYFAKPVDTQELLAQARTIRKFFDGAQLYPGSENDLQTQK